MSETAELPIAPVTGNARIDVLDMLRGIAILGIFFMNIPFMGAPLAKIFVDTRSIGWGPADQASWTAVQLLLEGTQRGLLELLFGAGMMVLTARAMRPDGPVAIADLYTRRNLWLLGFGLVDIFLLIWAGDILHIYALAALFLFPFRKLGPKLLLALGFAFALYVLVSGGIRYAERATILAKVEVVHAKQAAKTALTEPDKKVLADWQKVLDHRKEQEGQLKELAKQEAKGHGGNPLAYLQMHIGFYIFFIFPEMLISVCEAFCVMLIGIALWKWQVIQGGRSARFYLALMLGCYIPALIARYLGAQEILNPGPIARTFWFSQELARIATAVGHLALVNLAVKSGIGRAILSPFKAAGRTAFSLYFLQQIIGLWIVFAPWGLNLWGKLSWSGLYTVVLAVVIGELILANIWVRFFANGPMEWAWRSLSYVKWQPFLRSRA
jgi:uncharacterized protein